MFVSNLSKKVNFFRIMYYSTLDGVKGFERLKIQEDHTK